MCTSKAKPRNPLITSHCQARCLTISSKVGPHHPWWLLGKSKTTTPECTYFVLLSRTFVVHPICYGMFLWSQRSAVLLVPPLILLPTPGPLAMGARWEKRKPWHCARTTQQQPQHSCVINIVLVTGRKDSIIQAAMKKINSLPSRPTTDIRENWSINLTFVRS